MMELQSGNCCYVSSDALVMGCTRVSLCFKQHAKREVSCRSDGAKPALLSQQGAYVPLLLSISSNGADMCLSCLTLQAQQCTSRSARCPPPMFPAGPEEGCWHALGSPQIEQALSAVEGLLCTTSERAGETWDSQGDAWRAHGALSELAAVAGIC